MRALGVVLALAVSSACEIARPFDVHPDAVALSVLLVAGESEARMLAIHPNRERGQGAPKITASVQALDWTAEFSDTLPLDACVAAGEWVGPSSCLRAVLPEAVSPNVEYILQGEAPLGTFAGRMVVPFPALLTVPPDSLVVPLPRQPGLLPLAIRHVVSVDVGTLVLEVLDVFETQEDGTELEIPASRLGSFPLTIGLREENTISILHDGRPLRFSLRLHGLGWNYTNFLAHRGRSDPLVRPWPDFGIEGEGGHGYFDGVSISPVARVFGVVSEETPCKRRPSPPSHCASTF